jgi:death on curing protein
MMCELTVNDVIDLHRQVVEQSGGSFGVRDLGALESAVAQPQMTFGGEDLYPTVVDKAAALGFSLVMNHPFVDGNKRIGHAAMETFLVLNGLEIYASVED